MPRGPRPSPAGVVYHLITRANRGETVFHAPADYEAFTALIHDAVRRVPIDLLGWCLMPNHIHLVARPRTGEAMGRFMHWLLTTYAQRYKVNHEIIGHVWQGRYKSFPIQVDRHFVTVLRYVERNPVRAGLVDHAMNWRWSSLPTRTKRPGILSDLLAPSPVELPIAWAAVVDEPLTSTELARVRSSVQRGAPFGDAAWTRGAVERFGLGSTTRPPGRPVRL